MGDGLSPLPEFPEHLVEDCRKRKDAMPLVFEWYKHAGILAIELACLSPGTTGYRFRPAVHLAVMRGLLCRCTRLMLSTVKLAHDRGGAETIAVLLRCIAESAINVSWLSDDSMPGRFERFLADGLRTDLELKKLITNNVAERGGKAWVIEQRMLDSIERCQRAAGLDESSLATGRLPGLEQRMREAGYGDGLYTVVQRMGSHSVHGTWTDLLTYYVKEAAGRFEVRDTPGPRPQINHFVLPARLVLDAGLRFVTYSIANEVLRGAVREHFQAVADGLQRCVEISAGDDFEIRDRS